MNFWNQQFSSTEFKYGKQPNRFVQDQAVRLSPCSKVLLPGDGEGRNSVWIAQQGHQVVAMDQSAVGLQKAQDLAAERGVSIHTIEANLEDWIPEPASFDAVIISYLHLPPDIRPQAHRRLAQALVPGGWFILEVFNPRQLEYSSGGPKDLALLYTPEILRSDLAADATLGMQEKVAWHGEVQLEEGQGHRGPAYITRYIAQRGFTQPSHY